VPYPSASFLLFFLSPGFESLNNQNFLSVVGLYILKTIPSNKKLLKNGIRVLLVSCMSLNFTNVAQALLIQWIFCIMLGISSVNVTVSMRSVSFEHSCKVARNLDKDFRIYIFTGYLLVPYSSTFLTTYYMIGVFAVITYIL